MLASVSVDFGDDEGFTPEGAALALIEWLMDDMPNAVIVEVTPSNGSTVGIAVDLKTRTATVMS